MSVVSAFLHFVTQLKCYSSTVKCKLDNHLPDIRLCQQDYLFKGVETHLHNGALEFGVPNVFDPFTTPLIFCRKKLTILIFRTILIRFNLSWQTMSVLHSQLQASYVWDAMSWFLHMTILPCCILLLELYSLLAIQRGQ